jgi:hypothetical protein
MRAAAIVSGGAFALALAFGLPGRSRSNHVHASGTGSDGALAASADFTTGSGFIDVTLTNLLGASVIRSAGQALSDISFTLSNAPWTLTGTHILSGQLGNVSSTGVVTYVSGSPVRFLGEGPPPPGGTGFFSIVGNTITMEAIGGGQPSEMITPFVANGGTLSNVNNGFQNFNPYTIGPATFELDLSGITTGTTVTAVTFSFGRAHTYTIGTRWFKDRLASTTALPGKPGVSSSEAVSIVPVKKRWSICPVVGF